MKILVRASSILILFLAISIGMKVSQALAEDVGRASFTDSEKKSLESVVAENSRKLNQSLPIMVDSETRFDTTLAVGMQMHYKYTLVNLVSDDLDITSFRKEVEMTLIKSQKADKNAMLMLKAGLVCFYDYFDKDGALITQIRVDGSICGVK